MCLPDPFSSDSNIKILGVCSACLSDSMAKRELPAAEIHVEAACELGGVSVQGLSKEEVSLPSPCVKRNKVLDHQRIAELQ